MSTESRDYEYGRIVSVDIRTLGDNLVADTASGATTLAVEDAYDFDETGGQLVLGGSVLTYTAVDDETGIITLSDPTTANAFEGDAVNVYDATYMTVSTEKVAQVEVTGDDGNVDMLECQIALHLSDKIAEGVRGGRGESVKLELDGPDWVICDVLGLSNPDTSGGKLFKIDPFVVTAPGAQSLALTYEPLPESHHLYWNGDEQEGAYTIVGQTAEIDSTEGADLEVGDDLVVKYAYRNGPSTEVAASPLDIPGMLIWYSSDYPTYPAATNVPTWQDLSGNNYHATGQVFSGSLPSWYPSVVPGGGGAMFFQSGGYFQVPSAPFSGLTEAECWFVVEATAARTLSSFHQLTGSGDFQHYNDPIDHWQEQWGSTTRRDLGAISVTNWKRINFWTAPNDWACNVDGGNVLHDTTSNTVGFGAIGSTFEIGLGYVVAGSFAGYVSAFLMWDHKLTTDERAAVEAYLAANPSGGRP